MEQATCLYCESAFIPERRTRRFCSDKCKQAAYRERLAKAPKPVTTAHRGGNAALIAQVCRLYAATPGTRIADVTHSTGRFWARKPPGVTVIGSDIEPHEGLSLVADFTNLPYADASFDVVVLDPPYVHSPGTRNPHDYGPTTTRYNNRTVAGFYHRDIMELYRDGLREAFRILKPDGGSLWVKAKDQVQREIQCWSHIEIYEMALEIGFCARDLFVLTGTTAPERWPGRVQRHARKNQSFLWVFQRPDRRYGKLLAAARRANPTQRAGPSPLAGEGPTGRGLTGR